MCTSRTFLRCFGTFMDIAAVSTFPPYDILTLENSALLNILKERQEPFLVLLFRNRYGRVYMAAGSAAGEYHASYPTFLLVSRAPNSRDNPFS